MPTNVFGLRGTGDWATNQDPEEWREMMLFLYPNGDMPLFAASSMLPSEPVGNEHFSWFQKVFRDRAGTVTGVYTDSGLGTAYSSGGATGDNLYIKAAEAVVQDFIAGKTAWLIDTDEFRANTPARVTGRVLDGANSYVAVKLMAPADATYELTGVDFIMQSSNVNEQGGLAPDALSYQPGEKDNYTQIIRNSLNMSRNAKTTKTLRTGDPYEEAIRETLEEHGRDAEEATLEGIKSSGVGPTNKIMTSTQGIKTEIIENGTYGSNVDDYRRNSTYSGRAWTASNGGRDFLDAKLQEIFANGRDEKVAFVGSGALQGINKLAEYWGNIQLNVRDDAYGIRIMEWISPHGILYFKRHPLMSRYTFRTNSMLIFEPERVRFRMRQDTKFKEDNSEDQTNGVGRDGILEEFLTEFGIEHHYLAETGGFLDGIGLDA